MIDGEENKTRLEKDARYYDEWHMSFYNTSPVLSGVIAMQFNFYTFLQNIPLVYQG